MDGHDALKGAAPAALPGSRRALAVVAGAGAIAMLLAFGLLSALNGATEDGFRCARPRPGQPGECQILRSRLFGLAGNSAYSRDESLIRAASVRCPHPPVGRGGASCNVYFELTSGDRDLVLSFALRVQADRAAAHANAYLADRDALSLEIRESVWTTLAVSLAAPLLVVAVLLGLLRWRAARSEHSAG